MDSPADSSIRRTARRPVRAVGLLLLVQVVGLVGTGALIFYAIDWTRVVTLANTQNMPKPLEEQLGRAFVFVLFFLLPTVLLLLASLGFLVRGRGWTLAITAQSFILLLCIFSYPGQRPFYIYPIIAYCVLMVLYLNTRDVRASSHSVQRSRQRTARGG